MANNDLVAIAAIGGIAWLILNTGGVGKTLNAVGNVAEGAVKFTSNINKPKSIIPWIAPLPYAAYSLAKQVYT